MTHALVFDEQETRSTFRCHLYAAVVHGLRATDTRNPNLKILLQVLL